MTLVRRRSKITCTEIFKVVKMVDYIIKCYFGWSTCSWKNCQNLVKIRENKPHQKVLYAKSSLYKIPEWLIVGLILG